MRVPSTIQKTDDHSSSSCGRLSCGVTHLTFYSESPLHDYLAKSRASRLQTFEQAVKLYFDPDPDPGHQGSRLRAGRVSEIGRAHV